MTPHEEILIRAADEAKASEARAYQQMEHRTHQMLDARRAAEHMRGCMARMIGVVAAQHDPQLFAQVMGCLSQEDLSQMAFDADAQHTR